VSERRVDQELVSRAQEGDRRAFDLLVIKYQQKVAGLISRYMRDPSEVMDVTQEAFLKAYRALPGFRGESAFYTWLYRIAINTVKNYLVAQGRRPPGDDVEAEVAEQMDMGTRMRDVGTPESMLLSEEIAHTVQDALDALPDDDAAKAMRQTIETANHLEAATESNQKTVEILSGDTGETQAMKSAVETARRIDAAIESNQNTIKALEKARSRKKYTRSCPNATG